VTETAAIYEKKSLAHVTRDIFAHNIELKRQKYQYLFVAILCAKNVWCDVGLIGMLEGIFWHFN